MKRPAAFPIETLRVFTVRRADLDEQQRLAVCRLLRELTTLTDRAVKHAFGSMNYDCISATQYMVDFTGYASNGDVVELRTEVVQIPGRLELAITIHKKRNAQYRQIGQGNFVFTHNTHKARLAAHCATGAA